MTEYDASRRNVLYGVAAAGVAVPVLAACGPAGEPDSSKVSTSKSWATYKVSEIPVGGGKIFTDDQVVVTQPTAGVFKAFSAVCTHQGCILSSVASGRIDCGCHGSEFSIVDGHNVQGPNGTAAGSVRALEAFKATATGDVVKVVHS
ncbi:MAG: Rieske (2Fe-2S) protein [Marmoricola sp.]|nr:Rieske (2Fe-2S) protein [Marmoricola sp.]